MSEQPLDLRRSLRIVRRHKSIAIIATVLGILAGAGYTMLNQPQLVSSALVTLPSGTRDTGTQVVIASSDHVLTGALRILHPTTSLSALRGRIQVKSLTSNLLSVSAHGKTATQAEGTANAVANSYIAYVRTAHSAGGSVQAQLLEPAMNATGTSLPIRLVLAGGLGALLGLLIGAVLTLALQRNDRRLLDRDEIANAIGVPVLASIPVGHPSDAAGWTTLIEHYEPGVVHAWQLSNALRFLGSGSLTSANGSNGDSLSIAVLSLSSDPGGLALGPQFAVFAASVGIPTALVIAAQADEDATVALRAACAQQPLPDGRSSQLQVAVADNGDVSWRRLGAKLTVIVAVVDGRTPHVVDTFRANATLLGVSAGAATAVQLARVAVGATADGQQIDGILVADPDPEDRTTGRVPQLARPAHRRMPTRLTGIVTETRR